MLLGHLFFLIFIRIKRRDNWPIVPDSVVAMARPRRVPIPPS
jgi:hypothetical protein